MCKEVERTGKGTFSVTRKDSVSYEKVQEAFNLAIQQGSFGTEQLSDALHDKNQSAPNDPKQRHRNMFLSAIEKAAPEALAELYEIWVMPKPKEGNYSNLDRSWQQKRIEKLFDVYSKHPHVLPPQTRALVDWLKKRHLKVDWMLERVTETWASWSLTEQEGLLEKSDLHFAKYTPHYTEVVFAKGQFISFNLTHDVKAAVPWEVEEAFLRWQFEERLLECQRELQANLRRVEVKGKEAKHHFEWLVQYQTQCLSHADICDKWSESGEILEHSTVSRGLKEASDLIGLPLRPPGRGGRRPNS